MFFGIQAGVRPARSMLARSQVLAKSTVEFRADRCCRIWKLIQCILKILGVSLQKGGEILLLTVWNAAARGLESILRSGSYCGLESISILGPSCSLGSILRSGVQPARSCPLIALGSTNRARVH